MVVDTTKPYILILILVTLTLMQGHGGTRKQNFNASYLIKLSVDSNGIRCAVKTCWFD